MADINIDNVGDDLAKAFDDGFEQGKKATMQWVSVKDRLPEEVELVLAVEGGEILIAEYDAVLGKFFESCYGASFMVDETVYPTHWMPLPEPPEGE